MNNKVLLLIDIQNDFLPGGQLAVNDGEAIIPVVNSLQQKFEYVIATQDWHPQDHKSFASQHTGKKLFDQIQWQGLRQTLWPDHCVQGTYGAAFSSALDQNKIRVIFRKGMDSNIDSYSGFYDNGKKQTTGLAGYLKELQVDEVYLCGLAGDFCVYYTALHSVSEGFQVFVIEDAIRSISEEGYLQAKNDLLSKGVGFLESDNIVYEKQK